MEILIGLVLIACGVFLLVYGGMLFRFALAVGFFILGFSISMWLLSTQPATIRWLVSLVIGGVLALVGYLLVKMMLHMAGALLGTVLVLLILSVLPTVLPNLVVVILLLVGAGVVGFYGSRLGDWVIILSTTVAGAYAIVVALLRLFPPMMGVGADYALAQIPFTGQAMIIFFILFITGMLAQLEIRRVRGRYVNFQTA